MINLHISVILLFLLLIAPSPDSSISDISEAQSHINRAIEYYEQQLLVQALREFQQAQKLAPESPMPYVGMGMIFSQQGRLDSALVELKRAVDIDPDLAVAHKELGAIYWKQSKWDQAKQHYTKVIESNPKMVDGYMGLGLIFASQRQFEKAIEQFQKAVKIDPDFSFAYQSLGQAYKFSDRLQEATLAYQTAIKLNPQDSISYYELGIVYSRLKQMPQAISALKSAIALNPRYKAAHYNLAQLYQKSEKGSEAQHELEIFKTLHQIDEKAKPYHRSLEMNPEDLQARYSLAIIYYQQGWLKEALIECEILISISPNFVPAYIGAIETALAMKDVGQAAFWAKALVQAYPHLGLAHTFLGMVYAKQGLLDMAEKEYKIAISLEPMAAPAYNNLAWLYAEHDTKLDEALRFSQKAVELEAKAAHLDTLAWIYYKKRRYKEAESEMKKVMKLEPENPKYIEHWRAILNVQPKP